MSGTLKDQLGSLQASGALTVKPSNVTQRKAVPNGVKKAYVRPAITAEVRKQLDAAVAAVVTDINGDEVDTKPPANVAWANKAMFFLKDAFKASNRIPSLGSVREADFSNKLDIVESVVEKIINKIGLEQKHNRKRELTTARRAGETVVNYVKTVRQAAANNDIQASDFTSISRKMNGLMKELNTTLESVHGSNTIKIKVDKSLQAIEESNMTRYKVFQRQLDQALREASDKTLMIIDLPIVPILGGGVTTQDLINNHIPAEPMGGYSALLRQRIIGLNPSKLSENGHKKEEYVQAVLSQLNSRSNQDYMLVLNAPIADIKNKIYMYWIMPEAQLNALMTAGGKAVTVDSWGLAF